MWQSAVIRQLGRGPRASFTILHPAANAGRHEAVPSSIDDGCLLKEQEANLSKAFVESAVRSLGRAVPSENEDSAWLKRK